MKRQTPRIYMDYAAATPCSTRALRAMKRVEHIFANPGAPHSDGLAAKKVLDDARASIASVLAVKPQEIIFTSGATEANNLALIGVVRHRVKKTGKRTHVVVSAIEHSSIREVTESSVFSELADVTYVRPDEHGCIKTDALQSALTPETCLVSIGWANGEIGTIQPMRALSRVINEFEKAHNTSIVFHSDAGQSAWVQSPQPHGVGLSLATYSSTKLYGPRGVAVLFVEKGVELEAGLYGGTQERGLRPGTEDPYLATGFATALSDGERTRAADFKNMRTLRAEFIRELSRISGALINGTHSDQLPHVVNVSIPHIDSEYIMYALDHAGISMSTKSICLLESGDPISPVVEALGGPQWRATNTLRFSFGRSTTRKDIQKTVKILEALVAHVHTQNR